MEQTGESQSKRPGRHFFTYPKRVFLVPQRSALPFWCHSGRPCRPGGTAVVRATHKEGDLQESGRCQARRACLPGERHQEGSQTPGRPLRAANPRSLPPVRRDGEATRAAIWGRRRPSRARPAATRAATGRHGPSRPPLGRPPAVTGSHWPSWAATWERPPRRSPPLRPRPYPWSSLAGTGAVGISTFSTRLMSSCWEWTSSLR